MTILTSTAVLWFARAALVLAVALVATRLLARTSAAVRHGVLAAGLLAVLALPAITALVPAWHTGALPSSASPAASVSVPDTVLLPVPETGPVAASKAAPAPTVLAETPASIPWGAIAATIWATGALALLLRAVVGARRARGIAARGTLVIGDATKHASDAWRALDGSGEPPRLVESAEVDSPIVVGALAPVVVVPRSSSAWNADRWRVVLLHELAHVRRRDALANLAAQLACALHWFDPLAWLAARRLREERELAADDAVLRAGARPSSYAEHLVAMAVAGDSPIAALAMAEPTRFESRVAALLDADRTRAPARARHAVAVAAAMSVVATIAACVSPEEGPRSAVLGPRPEEPSPPATAPMVDKTLQSLAETEIEHAMTAHHGTGATAIVLDAKTGAVLALAARGDTDARAPFLPGSTMKPFTFAAALDAGAVAADARIDCENGKKSYGDRTLTDSSPHGVLDLAQILAVSSNVCTAKLAEPLGDKLADYFHRFHFAAPDHVDTRSLAGASIASGEGLPASPLEVASGYTAFANAGVFHATDGTTAERVVSADTARTVLAMLERVVTDPDGTGRAAAISNVRVAGKTGTANSRVDGKYYASFVGIAPADAPRVIVLVGVDGVDGSGGKVAAPVFAAIASAALAR